MIERSLSAFSLALFGVTVALFLFLFPPMPIACGLGPNVNLPWAATATLIAGSETDLTIHIKADRSIFVGPNIVPRRLLAAQLAEIAERTPERRVLINADGTVPYASVEHVIQSTRQAGFQRISLVTFRGTRLEAWQRGGAV